METDILFKSIFRVIKFSGKNPQKEKAHSDMKVMIEECEDLYPGIDIWFKKKASPELKEGKRHGIIIYHDDKPVGSAIVRKGEHAKLCSMRILPDYQYNHLGRLLMAIIALDIRHLVSSFHFTIPEELWETYGEFFKDYGFHNHSPSERQYRLFSQELACSASYKQIWSKVVDDLPKLSQEFRFRNEPSLPDILLSVHPEYAYKIISGEKTVEIRKGFSKRWKGSKVSIYATKPVQELVGEAEISEVEIDTPSGIWDKYETELGCDHFHFKRYCGNNLNISVIHFTNALPYNNNIPISQLGILLESDLHPPQSYNIIRNNQAWLTAVSLGKILRCSV